MYLYTAIIIEPRKHKAIEFVLDNILDCLSDEWKVVFFHGTNNIEYSKNITDKLNVKYNNRIELIMLDVINLDQKSYSKLLATKTVIYDYIQTDYFLIFQTDSMMFKRNSHLIYKFIENDYDYVGAPWLICGYYPTKKRNFIGNGGFSLRKKSKVLEIIDKHKWNENDLWHEDLFFTDNYDDVIISKPPYDMAKIFCVDEVFSDVTMACHKTWCHNHFDFFSKIYPECITLKELQLEEE